ncbi:virion protein [Photobacterium sp. TY1-4]|uniref:virion protein n=1 Tax=Photobacterium sp. TY1-4 TaxID=2899122 RepID=UPI0021BE7FE3|nr:virion protein [Photobacterium sp. TY1-4]UXI02745.1 virion protein [Photobacterium sp. TY1-4]
MRYWPLYLMAAMALIFGISRNKSQDDKTMGQARGIRNHNPLNIEYSERNQWRGQVGTDGRFAIFEEPKWGFRAAARILRSYKRRGVKTIHDIVHTFAPSHENNSDHYANMVSRWTGYGKHQVVDVENDDTAAVIIQAMARMEVGHRYPISDVMKGVKLA